MPCPYDIVVTMSVPLPIVCLIWKVDWCCVITVYSSSVPTGARSVFTEFPFLHP